MNPVQFYKCLADETRLRSVMLIQQEGELCVCELMAALQEIQPKVSRHLAQLRKCNLLLDRKQGQWVFYRINPALPDWAKEVLQVSSTQNPVFLKANMQNLSLMNDKTGGRPERTQVCC